MRDALDAELDGITESLVEMAGLVGTAMADATTALLEADLRLAESVISADATVDLLRSEVEERTFDAMGGRQPTTPDLRAMVTSMRVVADLERMGDLALHIAKIARRRYPASAAPPELRDTLADMGRVAHRMVVKTGTVLSTRDVRLAAELERDDDRMDALHRRLFQVLLEKEWPHGMEAAVDLTLIGRFYERYADHAVSVARRVVYLVTGERGVA